MFGLYTGGETLWLLTYHGSPVPPTPTAADAEHDAALDVSLLHNVLLEKVLGIVVREDSIAYTQDDAMALDLVAPRNIR